MDLSIIIVSYKSKEHLKVLLPSIFASTKKYSYEVIVVDNDSQDGTAESVSGLLPTIPNLKLIKNQNNGFSAGNNLGMKNSSGRYILLLNPDTQVRPDTFEIMLDMMENRPNVGISGCKLIKADGELDLACRRRFPNPWNSFKRLFLRNNKNYNYTDVDENHEMEVDSVVGAFLLIRKSVADKIGLLDEKFFMYGEDLDWCWRCKESGYKVWYYPKTTIVHYKGESSRKTPFKMLKAFHDAMWIFYKKHYYKNHFMIFNSMVWLGIYGRMLGLMLVNLFKKDRAVSR
jgi:GT2 family glycosyltransferase